MIEFSWFQLLSKVRYHNSRFDKQSCYFFSFHSFHTIPKTLPGFATNRSPPVFTDDPLKSHGYTTEVASAAFDVATGDPPIIPLVVTESSTGGHR